MAKIKFSQHFKDMSEYVLHFFDISYYCMYKPFKMSLAFPKAQKSTLSSFSSLCTAEK